MNRTVVAECSNCKGSGLHKGRKEHDGAAVICNYCKGTGKVEIEYNEFEGRKEMPGVKRVFEGGFGYEYSDKDMIQDETGEILHFSKYGCSYEEWKKGVKPASMEELYCPYTSCGRNVKEDPCSRCQTGIDLLEPISSCRYYSDKAECWREWHKNND